MGSTRLTAQELDLRNIRAEIEDLRLRLAAAGQERMAYFLNCAKILADRQIQSSAADAADVKNWGHRRLGEE